MTRTAYHAVRLANRPAIFRDGDLAMRVARRTRERVVLGECGEYLLVTNADAQRLVRAGYELA